jgi:cytolysin-activating lysine-acyltransferase
MAIGHAVWLMSRSPMHKHLMITDIEWLVTPPIMLSQFRLWQKDGNPIGYASWALLGEEAEERIVTRGIRRLMPTDWKSGENLWLIDFLSPFGGQEEMLKELREKVHPGKKMKMIQAAPGGGTGVVEW